MRLHGYDHQTIDYFDPSGGPETEFVCLCGFFGDGLAMDRHLDASIGNELRTALEQAIAVTHAGD